MTGADFPNPKDPELDEHPDPETLAAYVEGNLPATAVTACEDHLGRCGPCLDLVRGLWESREGDRRPTRPPGRAQRRTAARLVQAACLLIGIGGVIWGFVERRAHRRGLERQAQLEKDLFQTRLSWAVSCKERFFARSPSPLRSFWGATASASSLGLPPTRGAAAPSAEARAESDEARRRLIALGESPEAAAAAVAQLELASLEIVAGDFAAAERCLQQAEERRGATPEATNLRALCLVGRGDDAAVEAAITTLRGLTDDHPDFLPARYNLALLLEQTFRDAESRQAWQEYLRREDRPEYRAIAEKRLAAIQP